MTGADLKQMLLAGADGCTLAQNPIVALSCTSIINLVEMFQRGELYRDPNNGDGRYRLTETPKTSTELVINLLTATRDWNLKGNFAVTAETLQDFSERRRILAAIAWKINRNR